MSKQIVVKQGIQKEQKIHFDVSEIAQGKIGTPSGTMITDSDKMAFVYLLDEDDGYSYIHFMEETWPLMVDALKLQVDPVVVNNGDKITLNGFIDELTMLIFNIEGNQNYGETFSLAVEKAFAEILQQ